MSSDRFKMISLTAKDQSYRLLESKKKKKKISPSSQTSKKCAGVIWLLFDESAIIVSDMLVRRNTFTKELFFSTKLSQSFFPSFATDFRNKNKEWKIVTQFKACSSVTKAVTVIYIYIYIYISGDSSLFLLLVPPPRPVNLGSQPVVRGPKVSHHSCYCVILHCIAQIDKRTSHGVFFCKQSRYYIICSLVNTVDKIVFSFQKYRRKEKMFITMTRKICLLE